MSKYKYQWNENNDHPYIARFNINTYEAEVCKHNNRVWVPDFDAKAYFLGIDNSLFDISEAEVNLIIEQLGQYFKD